MHATTSLRNAVTGKKQRSNGTIPYLGLKSYIQQCLPKLRRNFISTCGTELKMNDNDKDLALDVGGGDGDL